MLQKTDDENFPRLYLTNRIYRYNIDHSITSHDLLHPANPNQLSKGNIPVSGNSLQDSCIFFMKTWAWFSIFDDIYKKKIEFTVKFSYLVKIQIICCIWMVKIEDSFVDAVNRVSEVYQLIRKSFAKLSSLRNFLPETATM